MILQFDVGNTRLKWRLLRNKEVVGRGSATLDEFDIGALCIGGELEGVQLAAVRQGSELDSLVKSVKRAYPAVDLYCAKAAARFGPVSFAYELPETQGVDRCLAMRAAYNLSSGRDAFRGVMVIDAGSAITVDVLDAQGYQVEGYILPGLSMMRESLLGRTSKISEGYRAKVEMSSVLSTRKCVDLGVLKVFFASILDFVERSKVAGLDLVVTGGDAFRLRDLLSSTEHYLVEDLVLDGLSIIVDEREA